MRRIFRADDAGRMEIRQPCLPTPRGGGVPRDRRNASVSHDAGMAVLRDRNSVHRPGFRMANDGILKAEYSCPDRHARPTRLTLWRHFDPLEGALDLGFHSVNLPRSCGRRHAAETLPHPLNRCSGTISF